MKQNQDLLSNYRGNTHKLADELSTTPSTDHHWSNIDSFPGVGSPEYRLNRQSNQIAEDADKRFRAVDAHMNNPEIMDRVQESVSDMGSAVLDAIRYRPLTDTFDTGEAFNITPKSDHSLLRIAFDSRFWNEQKSNEMLTPLTKNELHRGIGRFRKAGKLIIIGSEAQAILNAPKLLNGREALKNVDMVRESFSSTATERWNVIFDLGVSKELGRIASGESSVFSADELFGSLSEQSRNMMGYIQASRSGARSEQKSSNRPNRPQTIRNRIAEIDKTLNGKLASDSISAADSIELKAEHQRLASQLLTLRKAQRLQKRQVPKQKDIAA